MTQRVFFGDVKPYAVPDSLEELRGPYEGAVNLPMWVYWAPGSRSFRVDDPDQAEMAYIAVLSEGILTDVCEFVNAQRLRSLWGQMVLPRRARAEWEQRFPELAEA